MLLFQKRFHAGLVDRSITLTFRAWSKAQVRAGGRYRCHPIGVLEVDAIARVPVASIDDAQARRAGFAGRDELLAYLGEVARLDADHEIFRVELHHAGDGDRVELALETGLTADDVAAISAKLAKMDERSASGPWTRKTLALIGRRPRTAASQLARSLGREKLDFKADVVKLKKLGLTQSFEVGYEISPRGLAYLAARGRARRPAAKRSRERG